MPTLGVNIDHIATVRQARKTTEPDPVWAAAMAELGGADQITIHLRQDRRHIQDRDLRILRETVNVRLNLECACIEEMLMIACQSKPYQVCLVPEKREEVTTEGGLDVVTNLAKVKSATQQLKDSGIVVSLFVDPDAEQIDAALACGADAVELHTGTYANDFFAGNTIDSLAAIDTAARRAHDVGLHVDAGHGLTYKNVLPIVAIETIKELNIGHSIISRALFVGLQQAVREMKELCKVETKS
ncbi:MAG: pyridoxine 5'-phosphate synthase [Planctomycetota bacterium]